MAETLIGTAVIAGAKVVAPLIAVGSWQKTTRITGPHETGPYARNTKYTTPYAKGDFEKYPVDVHQLNLKLKPVFKTKIGAFFGSSSYTPPMLAASNRTKKGTKEEEEAKAVSRNDIGGGHSVVVYNDNVVLKERMIRGDFVMRNWGGLNTYQDSSPTGKSYRQTQVTPHRLIISLRSHFDFALFKQKQYKLSDSEARRILGKNAEIALRNDLQPGWQAECASKSLGWAVSVKLTANVRARIVQQSYRQAERGLEYMPIDLPWIVEFMDTSMSAYKVKDVAGFGKPDTLTETHSFSSWREVKSNWTSDTSFPRMTYTTLQEAISQMEALGIDFDVEYHKSPAWPNDRSRMYASNFPYRGLTKKPVGVPFSKRQKGGDAPRVYMREEHCEIQNHFDGKTDDYVFA